MPVEEATALIFVLSTLVRRGLEQREAIGMAPTTNRHGQALAKALRSEISIYDSFDRNGLAGLMQSPVDHRFPEDKFIALEPSSHTVGCAAFLWCRWDYGGEPHCTFYYGLFRLAPRHKVAGEPEKEGSVPQFVGFRYESPSWQGDQEHRFYHVQPTTNMSPDPKRTVRCAVPIPDKAPTFPLPAGSPLELLLCFILSVLGVKVYDEISQALRNEDRANRNKALTGALDKVRAIVK